MAITSQQARKVSSFIKQIKDIRGRHTELVSVYVPKDYDLNKIIQTAKLVAHNKIMTFQEVFYNVIYVSLL